MDAIVARNITKIFKIYDQPLYRVIESLSPLKVKNYHAPFKALDNVSFDIKKGETVGLIGINGSGKSTLLQIICGILKNSGGEVRVNGRISALLELGSGFNPEYTGRENIYFSGTIMGISSTEMDQRIYDIERFADIGFFLDQPVKTYSSGMYVRLAFAVAINVDPEILIVDEALSVGDTAFQAKCFAKFKEFQEKGVTILFVTHSMDLITRYCSTAMLLQHGRLVKKGRAKDVVDEYNRLIVNCNVDDCHTANEQKTERKVKKRQIGPVDKNDLEVKVSEHMFESELAYTLNPDENRYGNGKAEIIDVGIKSLSEKTKYSFIHGERYCFWFKTIFHEPLVEPITAFTIKDIKGFDITGTNTLYKGKNIGLVKRGDIIVTEFEHRMMLNPGGYLLSFGCAGFENGEYVVYDRRYDVITFDVISEQSSVGIFDLDSIVTIKKIESHT